MCENYAGNHLKKADFCMLFCFCEVFSRIIRVLQLFHLLLKNGLVITRMSYGCYEYIIFRDVYFLIGLYLHNLNGVPEKCQHPNSTRFKVKLIIHHRPVSTATNRSYLFIVIILLVTVRETRNSFRTPRYHPIALTSIISATMSFLIAS